MAISSLEQAIRASQSLLHQRTVSQGYQHRYCGHGADFVSIASSSANSFTDHGGPGLGPENQCLNRFFISEQFHRNMSGSRTPQRSSTSQSLLHQRTVSQNIADDDWRAFDLS